MSFLFNNKAKFIILKYSSNRILIILKYLKVLNIIYNPLIWYCIYFDIKKEWASIKHTSAKASASHNTYFIMSQNINNDQIKYTLH